MAKSDTSFLLVAAFDFGTTYTGYAFSFRSDKLKVHTNNWIAGTGTLISHKTPTCVLLEPSGEFHSLGYQAENKYASLAEENEHHGWMLFRQFKMTLHDNKKLTRSTLAEDINGKQMEAMKIISMAIRYLRNHLLTTLNTQTFGIEEEQIFYVLTVPAIWDDSAKQFTREAAEQVFVPLNHAGIDGSRLKLALEPETASLWCQTVTDDAKPALCGVGAKYMVVDLGGGTADITVHEKLVDGTLKELHKASGGPWGGMNVDINYLKWLKTIFGDRALEHIKKHEMLDYFEIIRQFETKKRTITATSTDQITFPIPVSLKNNSEFAETDRSLQQRLERLNLSGSVSAKSDKMRVKPDVFRRWFEGPVDNVVSHVQMILGEKNMEGVNTILLVGGFGESAYVHDKFKKTLSNKRIIVPDEAGLVVLKGAVKFGHAPRTVSQRIMKYTYGFSVYHPYDEDVHPASLMVLKSNEKLVENVFSKFVSARDSVVVGQEVVKRDFKPTDSVHSFIHVYRSTDSDPKFTTDKSCSKLGKFRVEHCEGDTLKDKMFDVVFVFGDTELIVKAKFQNSKNEFFKRINCLE